MRVCKHGCDVNLLGFPRPHHASTNLKKVLSLTGLSLRAGAGDFPRLLRGWPPATFIRK